MMRLARRAEQLQRTVDPGKVRFATTAEVKPLIGTVDQDRVLDAIDFRVVVGSRGFNLFDAGEPGTGRMTTVLDTLAVGAAAMSEPVDWVYVHNFANPDRPRGFECEDDEGIALLTRRPADVRAADGSYPPESVDGLAAARLADYAERLTASVDS